MNLDLLRQLPERGTTGWLINVKQQQDADARFSAHRGGHPTYDVAPLFVRFSAERSDKYPPASYHWEGDTLIVCMVYVQFASAEGSDKIHLIYDYNLCAPMVPAIR